ncbi:threonine-phosphate decarboxylase CobD [uncultured Paraglaciecola sp.]|uniref:threonine-phosphate decarboxylase CobD n=1 Tax=uncultured Paraglaciecola sp. TaxID=1765024 RepID=UPI0030D78C30|tara:strand:- start:25898 stop:26926 length:1029 start_codon:yes stop_codon:yes gene_type:complete
MADFLTLSDPLVHGGQLTKMAEHYGIPLEKWLDLSTGIAPFSYPIPAIPSHVWQRLPEPCNALQTAARDYYQTHNLLAISGSQVIIQLIPQIAQQQGYAASRVWLPEVGYQEHHKAWQNAAYPSIRYREIEELKQLKTQDIVILINPNNPSGTLYSYPQVAELFHQVKVNNGLLIIDEAFMDCTPQHSFINQIDSPNLIILRSLGKFFGLAGLRLGFVAAANSWLALFKRHLGPWSINGPAQYIGQQALIDNTWQNKQRHLLAEHSGQLAKLLQQRFKQPPSGTMLFQTVKCQQAEVLFDKLCQQGIYVRLCDEKNALRFGIPTSSELIRLQLALSTTPELD